METCLRKPPEWLLSDVEETKLSTCFRIAAITKTSFVTRCIGSSTFLEQMIRRNVLGSVWPITSNYSSSDIMHLLHSSRIASGQIKRVIMSFRRIVLAQIDGSE